MIINGNDVDHHGKYQRMTAYTKSHEDHFYGGMLAGKTKYVVIPYVMECVKM